jgi:hypothetical protein
MNQKLVRFGSYIYSRTRDQIVRSTSAVTMHISLIVDEKSAVRRKLLDQVFSPKESPVVPAEKDSSPTSKIDVSLYKFPTLGIIHIGFKDPKTPER